VTFANDTTGEITTKPITVTAVTGTKMYDGGTTSAGVPTVTPGVASGDTANFTQGYDSKNVGTGKTLTPAGSVTDGNSGANYAVTFANDTTGEITTKPITVTAATCTKVYDGGTSSTAVPTVAPGVAAGDTANFSETYDTASIGTGKTLTPAGSVTDGNGGANYAVTFANDTTGVITGAASTAALISSANPSTNGDSVTFTATISSGAGTPTGDVVFKANAVPFSTNTLVSGVASASTAALAVGTNTVTVEYAAQANWLGSSNSLDQVVKTSVVYSQTNLLLSISDNSNGTYTLSLQGTPGANYYIVTSGDVLAPMTGWSSVTGSTNTAPGPDGLWSFTVSNAAPAFYRSAAVNPAP
ncbi:MAG: YDG domain-containing protein, partial [Verrucomicrobiota bacterium]